jgi:hypothetical protein
LTFGKSAPSILRPIQSQIWKDGLASSPNQYRSGLKFRPPDLGQPQYLCSAGTVVGHSEAYHAAFWLARLIRPLLVRLRLRSNSATISETSQRRSVNPAAYQPSGEGLPLEGKRSRFLKLATCLGAAGKSP